MDRDLLTASLFMQRLAPCIVALELQRLPSRSEEAFQQICSLSRLTSLSLGPIMTDAAYPISNESLRMISQLKSLQVCTPELILPAFALSTVLPACRASSYASGGQEDSKRSLVVPPTLLLC